tara:strand:+ start:873 stop:974 length:102 start_codon:yes stop_codon:yes gene_type:complete
MENNLNEFELKQNPTIKKQIGIDCEVFGRERYL